MTTPSLETVLRPLVLVRAALGGVLMGLANLVPGISGGTMLLAAGIYPRFVAAVAEVSTLRFRVPALVLLGTVAVAALAGIVLLAGPIKDLVVHHRWIMYSLFVGLTLGGLPVVWRMARPATRSVFLGAGGGFVAMSALAIAQASGVTGGDGQANLLLLGLAGLAGASAMILPGVSGGYLLLVLGQYVPILGAIETVKDAVAARDLAAATEPAVTVLLPVGVGVVVGVVVVSNALKWLLARYEKATLGVLIGLLLGAVVGLWPFQAPVEPPIGSTVKGEVVTAESLATIEVEDWPTRRFTPDATQVGGAIGLVVLGFALTSAIARLGRDESNA
jgi:putative membrane protein